VTSLGTAAPPAAPTILRPPVAAPADDGGALGRRPQADAAVRTGAAVLLWAGLLQVTYWWVVDGGVQALGGWTSGLTSLGQLSGLLASVLLLAQVLLMARLPLLERAYGQDRLARVHRVVGFTSFSLMLLHIASVTWGYAGGRLVATPATLWELTWRYPGMLLAVAGTAALVLVVVTSVRAARRRLRYESWHLLHLYAYLGVGLALPHQLWTGAQFVSSPGRTLFWWSAWGAAAGAVLVWRIGRPLLLNARHRLRVASVVAEAPGVWSIRVTGRHLDRLRVEAGQFFVWRFLDRPGWTRGNPYSLSAAPDGRSLRLTVGLAGDGSAAVPALRPGTRVLVEGPYGRLGGPARTRRRVAFIGAGVGIAPLRALAEELPYAPGEAVLLERYTTHPLFVAELDRLAAERGLGVLRLPGHRRSADSWLGDGIGPVDDLHALRWWVPDIAERDVFVCGPEPWSRSVARTLTAAGLPPAQLHIDNFNW
jgi:predicted ferric reductase